ncbi:protein lifeguard 3-like [Sebastes umbrosus]|uniref:protein lifeguard 3-like n=1 Tax=Sebastes umbrosus TaxID=72105 RepID=UPI00189F6B9E|nr:protein lifeguard 3-like [Sebastes umbrosus]
MSDTADSLTSKETQDAPGYDVSSPPPPPPPLSYSSEGQQPPPYSAALAMCPPPKIETTCTYQPTTGYDSFPDVSPKASSDTTPLKSSSSFDDKTVRRTFIRKVFSILAVQLLFTFSVMCVFTFSEVEEIQTDMCLSSFIIFIVAATALSCCKSFSRRHPWNTVGLVGYKYRYRYCHRYLHLTFTTKHLNNRLRAQLTLTI